MQLVKNPLLDLPFRSLINEIHAWTLYPAEQHKKLRIEAMQHLNSDYFSQRRPDLIRIIEENNADPFILSKGRYLLKLPDEKYETETKHQQYLTVHIFWENYLKSSLTDHMRVFIMLMEFLHNKEANQKKFNEEFLGHIKSKKSPLLKKLGNITSYNHSFGIYKNVSPFILMTQSLFWLELVDPEGYHHIFTSLDPSGILKRIVYFKKALLLLTRKNTKPAELFQSKDFVSVQGEVPFYLSQEEFDKIEKERKLIWSFLRPVHLKSIITSEKIKERLRQRLLQIL